MFINFHIFLFCKKSKAPAPITLQAFLGCILDEWRPLISDIHLIWLKLNLSIPFVLNIRHILMSILDYELRTVNAYRNPHQFRFNNIWNDLRSCWYGFRTIIITIISKRSICGYDINAYTDWSYFCKFERWILWILWICHGLRWSMQSYIDWFNTECTMYNVHCTEHWLWAVQCTHHVIVPYTRVNANRLHVIHVFPFLCLICSSFPNVVNWEKAKWIESLPYFYSSVHQYVYIYRKIFFLLNWLIFIRFHKTWTLSTGLNFVLFDTHIFIRDFSSLFFVFSLI